MHSAFTVEDLLALEVRNLYAAEKRPTRVLSRMHLGSRNPTLKSAFEDHFAETDQQVRRIEDIADMLQIGLAGGQCEGMDGCVRRRTPPWKSTRTTHARSSRDCRRHPHRAL